MLNPSVRVCMDARLYECYVCGVKMVQFKNGGRGDYLRFDGRIYPLCYECARRAAEELNRLMAMLERSEK